MSLPRSGRGASRSTGRAAPPRGGRPGVILQAPKPDVFVALLGVALGAIFLGCILLVLTLNAYEFELKATAVPPPTATTLV